MKRLLLVICAVLLTGCSVTNPHPIESTVTITPTTTLTVRPSTTPTLTPAPLVDFADYAAIFDYDASVPLNISWLTEYPDQDAIIHTLSYQGTGRCQVDALLVTPQGDGPYPAVIYMHRGNEFKTQYLEEAILLAGQGVVSLLPASAFDTGCDSYGRMQRQGYIDTVLFIRRGVDLLQSLPYVDGGRLAYVGHSFGATWGGVLAGVEPRIHSFVLIAGLVNISDYEAAGMDELDALNYIGQAVNDAFLLQFSFTDRYISAAAARLYTSYTPGNPTVLWYHSTHEDLQYDGQADRIAWLLEQLEVSAG
jgi:dienelactone hydrolase